MNALILETGYTFKNSGTCIFNDKTPLWDVTSAPGGYDNTGVNCVDPSDIDTGTLRVSIQKLVSGVLNTAVVITIPPGELVISDIGSTGLITYEIPLVDYTFTDGIYYFVYSFEDSSTSLTYTSPVYKACTVTLQCCLDEKFKDIPICPTCDRSKVQGLWEAQMFLEQINNFLECDNYIGAQEVLDYLNDFCDIANCDCD